MSDGNMASDLVHLVNRLQKTKGNFMYDEYRLLICLVIQRPPDIELQSIEKWNIDIWTAVFSLINNFSQTTPPMSIPPSFDSTPVKSNSSSQKGSEQTHELVNPRIFEEIHDCTFQDVKGFFDIYFEEKDWSGKADAICQHVLAPDSDEDLLSESHSIYCTTMSKADLTGSKAEQQVDLLLQARGGSLSQNKHNWRDILVIGELKKSKKEIRTKATLLQISCCVHEVFAAQPTRRFVHAFTVCGTKMEAWVFDRSGPYSSGIIDVYTDSKRFSQVLVGYTMMSDEELGLDIFIARNKDKSIVIKEPGNSEEKKVLLGKMLSYQSAIVCRGTTCFLANDGQVEGVAKFSWVSDKRRPEAELLKLADQKNVWGSPGSLAMLPSLPPAQPPDFIDPSRSLSPVAPISVESCHPHTSQASDRNDEELYDNCVLQCLVISPAGRPIYDYRSPLELLTALRDAIKAHRSLYLDGNILHLDISENNIIITDPDKADGHSGMLIDLDLAKEVGSEQSGARHRTGTMEFMAIEVLLNIDHTYRHDLESFFYVLIWQCYTGNYEDIANAKYVHMNRAENLGFGFILREFPAKFHGIVPLCQALRDILFPYNDKGIIIGTPQDPNRLYDPIIKAYDDAISLIGCRND
ncbi:hypothetical protein ACO22_00922 [Paracoccidioides brasiliensis]|uniref:Fungal-type protein kinase domain-containing protein n=1 Tax=Paracoccidioides brasiliensis TaxID=121759 RepID=A0A1D2JMZ3_PARBR|nr:hypothetical protein ACO22_00922 [Paracoccidioides brasiliensis]